jgi:hypothetical protein
MLIAVLTPIYLVRAVKGSREEAYLFLLFALIFPIVAITTFESRWIVYAMPFFLLILVGFANESLRVRGSRSFSEQRGGVRNRSRVGVGLVRKFIVVLIMIFLLSAGVIGAATPLVDHGELDGVRSAALYLKEYAPAGAIVVVDPFIARQLGYYVSSYQLNLTLVLLQIPSLTASQSPLVNPLINPWGLQVKRIIPENIISVKPAYIIMGMDVFQWGLNQTMRNIILSEYRVTFLAQPPVGYNSDQYWWSELTQKFTIVVLQRVMPVG